MAEHICIICGNDTAANRLEHVLLKENYQVKRESTGDSGLYRIKREFWQLVVLDADDLNQDGLDIIAMIREHSAYLPVFFLSASKSSSSFGSVTNPSESEII